MKVELIFIDYHTCASATSFKSSFGGMRSEKNAAAVSLCFTATNDLDRDIKTFHGGPR
jgi:hypothetical protein